MCSLAKLASCFTAIVIYNVRVNVNTIHGYISIYLFKENLNVMSH